MNKHIQAKQNQKVITNYFCGFWLHDISKAKSGENHTHHNKLIEYFQTVSDRRIEWPSRYQEHQGNFGHNQKNHERTHYILLKHRDGYEKHHTSNQVVRHIEDILNFMIALETIKRSSHVLSKRFFINLFVVVTVYCCHNHR